MFRHFSQSNRIFSSKPYDANEYGFNDTRSCLFRFRAGLICADRDGNRIRIDRVDPAGDTLSYHFLNDELRVQEGIQESSIGNFLSEGWYMATGLATL